MNISEAKNRINSGEDIQKVITEALALNPEDVSAELQGYQNLLNNPEISKLAEEGDLHKLTQYLREQNFANLSYRRFRRIAGYLIYQKTYSD